jgi:hypothetical protein
MLAAITLTASASMAAPAAQASSGSDHGQVAQLRAQIKANRADAVARARWVGVLLQSGSAEDSTSSVPYLTWLRDRWHRRSMSYGHVLLHRLPVYMKLLCIHRYEGSWRAYSAAGPYYGGLQMDASFMARYGPRFLARFGDARNWQPGLQVATAYRAVQNVGYSPWPVTSQACGA